MNNLNPRILKNRLAWIKKWNQKIELLPLDNYENFCHNKRALQTAELALRRSMEALVELGAYILKEGFGKVVTKYTEVPTALLEAKVLSPSESQLLQDIALHCEQIQKEQGHEATAIELYQTCHEESQKLLTLEKAFAQWIAQNLKSDHKHPQSE